MSGMLVSFISRALMGSCTEDTPCFAVFPFKHSQIAVLTSPCFVVNIQYSSIFPQIPLFLTGFTIVSSLFIKAYMLSCCRVKTQYWQATLNNTQRKLKLPWSREDSWESLKVRSFKIVLLSMNTSYLESNWLDYLLASDICCTTHTKKKNTQNVIVFLQIPNSWNMIIHNWVAMQPPSTHTLRLRTDGAKEMRQGFWGKASCAQGVPMDKVNVHLPVSVSQGLESRNRRKS